MATLGDDNDCYVEESLPFLREKVCDLAALLEHGYFTVAQCALIVPSHLYEGNNSEEADTLFEHYFNLLMLDIAKGDVNPKHPVTRLPYSEYLRMMAEGMFGEEGERMPIPTADWLVSLEDTKTWLYSKGIDINFEGLENDLAKHGQEEKPVNADWKDKAKAIAQEVGLERYNAGIRQISARSVCDEVSTRLAKDTSTHGLQGPRGADNVRGEGLKNWKFAPPKGEKSVD